MSDFKNLLTIKPNVKKERNILNVWVKMDSNDADYIERTRTMYPFNLFDNKKLIYCLAYVTTKTCADKSIYERSYRNKPLFGRYVPENRDIKNLCNILSDCDFMVYSDWGECHTYEDLKITYYDENGNEFDITFDDIHKQFETMTYAEICEMINNIECDID